MRTLMGVLAFVGFMATMIFACMLDSEGDWAIIATFGSCAFTLITGLLSGAISFIDDDDIF